MVKPTNNSHCEAISIEAKASIPAGEVSNLASLECLINSKLYYMSKKRGDAIYAQDCWNFKSR